MSQPQTVFRFVTIRNPRKPSKFELETGFIFYRDKINAPWIEKVVKEQDRGAMAVTKLIASFVGENEFLRDTLQLEARHGDLVELGDWLMSMGGALTVRALEARLQVTPIQEKDGQERELWNNLVVLTLAGGVPEVREGVINALRALNLTRVRKELLKDEAAVKRLATATIILPSGTSTPPNREGVDDGSKEPPRPGSEGKEKVKAAWAKIAQYEAAHAELSARFAEETAWSRAQEAPVAPTPRKSDSPNCGVVTPSLGAGAPDRRIGVINDAFEEHLCESTKTVLRSLKVPKDARVPQVLDAIEQASARVAASVAQSPKDTRKVVQVGGAFWMAGEYHTHELGEPKAPRGRIDLEYDKYFPKDGRGCKIKPLGIADYRRVEQEICCYEPGEVAHIENVMRGEEKTRVTRQLKRVEETFTLSTEEERTEEKDTQTTDRFELEKETEKAVQEDIKFDIGVNVQAQYGPVKITADTKFGYSNSTKESDKQASKYAKEVTDRALERVTKKVKEERVTKTINEFEETNTHKLSGGDRHNVGLYRWVNKIYKAKVVNYGKRLMFEFMIPEPGAFHLWAMTNEEIEKTIPVEKPVDPRSPSVVAAYGVSGPLTNADSVTTSNYLLWGAIYGAKLEPPPLPEMTISKSYNREGMDDGKQFSDSKGDLKVPDGYEASSFYINWGFHQHGDNWATVMVGRWSKTTPNNNAWSHTLDGEDDFVPFAIMGKSTFYACNVEVRSMRREETLKAWKIKTFDAIVKAFDDRMSAYEVAFAEAKARAGVEIRGTNPLRNREIEMLELKKGALRLLTECLDLSSTATTDADPNDPCSVPQFDCCRAIREGSYVQFLEQAFEWKLITYLFYPYFWGRRCNWKKIYQLDDIDPLFLSFLQAGYAKVHVPVRPGYEAAVQRFLVDQVPWNGGSTPGVDSDMYLAIENEMKEPVGEIDPEVEPWDITVPTTLTVLQCESGCVEGNGLPCPCESQNPGAVDPSDPPPVGPVPADDEQADEHDHP